MERESEPDLFWFHSKFQSEIKVKSCKDFSLSFLIKQSDINKHGRQYLHIHAPVILVVILFACRGHYGWVGDPCRMHAGWAEHQRVREPGGGERKRWRREVWRKTETESDRKKKASVSSEKCVLSGADGDGERQSKSESVGKQ